MPALPEQSWRTPVGALEAALESGEQGLSDAAAGAALARCGPNRLEAHVRLAALEAFAARFRDPLVLPLVAAATISAATGDAASAPIIVVVVSLSVTLDVVQMRRAETAVERLRAMVRVTARVRRAGAEREIPSVEVVPGDLLLLAAGDAAPADGMLVGARDLFINQATLTGVTFGVLLWVFQAGPELFRTGWFVESVASQVLVIFAVRTRLGLFAVRPHRALVAAALGVLALAVALPFAPFAPWIGFTPPPGGLLAAVAVLVALYLGLVELVKRRVGARTFGTA